MKILIVPEPTEVEREALLAALREPENGPAASVWQETALREGVGAEELAGYRRS